MLWWMCLHSPGELRLQPVDGMHGQAAGWAGFPCSWAAIWAWAAYATAPFPTLVAKAIRLQNQPH